jgi:hypothetical protein
VFYMEKDVEKCSLCGLYGGKDIENLLRQEK